MVSGGTTRRDGRWAVPQRMEVKIGHVGSGNITARPPRRSFWAWLRREPRPYALPAGRP